MNKDGLILISYLLMIIIGFIAGALGTKNPRSYFEAEAVEAGHAEYYLDENYDKQWRWLPTTQELKEQNDE